MIELEARDGVAVVRLGHGAVNAMDLEFCRALTDVFGQLAGGQHRAAVVVGNGRAFCAGVDLRRLLDGGRGYAEVFIPALVDCLAAAFDCPVPVVAAIDGPAIAGGCLLACAADYRFLASDRGRLGVPELVVGVPFPPTALEILRFATGDAVANELVMSGAVHAGQEALQRRLADALVPDGRLLDEAAATAQRLAEVPAATFKLTKDQLRRPARERIAAHREAFDDEVRAAWSSPEVEAAVSSFVERTLGPR